MGLSLLPLLMGYDVVFGMRTMFPRYDDRARDLSALPARLGKLGYKSAVVGDYAADIFTRVRYGFDRIDAPTFKARFGGVGREIRVPVDHVVAATGIASAGVK